MNTIENLITEYGIDKSTAAMMLDNYEKRIGTRKGDFEITDVEFIGNRNRRVYLACAYCGVKEERVVRDWDHLRKVKCSCRKERVRISSEEKKAEEKRAKYFVLQNEIGNIYGDYEIVGLKDEKYLLKCTECGAEKTIMAKNLFNGFWRDRICHTHRRVEEFFTEEYIGRKNNMLTVIDITHDEKTGKKRFVCRCDCGKIKRVKPTMWERGIIKSCGCLQEYRSIYADSDDRIKNIWRSMKRRCNNVNDKAYGNYGGRGIKITPEWMDFGIFRKWSYENGYENTKTIDRINPNGNYEPSNCRWTTYAVQNVNRRPRSEWNVKANG